MREVLESAVGMRAVLFDVDGTLYRQSPVRRTMIRRILRSNVANPAACARVIRIISAYRRAQEDMRASSFVGDVASAQIDMAASRAGVEASDVETVVQQWIEAAPLDVVGSNGRDHLPEVLTILAERGVKLGIVSDYPASPKLEALGIADRFDVVVAAQDPGVCAFKPNPIGLLVAMDALGVGSTDTLYVGDRSDVDGAAADAAGVRFHLVGSSTRRFRRVGASEPDVRVPSARSEAR